MWDVLERLNMVNYVVLLICFKKDEIGDNDLNILKTFFLEDM